MPKAIMHLLTVGISGVTLCERDNDISIYLILITNVVKAISRRGASAIINFVPANCPAEVRFDSEIKIVEVLILQ
jgi:hypothetical protein